MVTISIPRIAEPVAAQRISGKAAVFQPESSSKRLDQKNLQDPQVLAQRILTDAR
jgi:hypothetical protein